MELDKAERQYQIQDREITEAEPKTPSRPFLIQKWLFTKFGFRIAQVMSLFLEGLPEYEFLPFDPETATDLWFKPKHTEYQRRLKQAGSKGYWMILAQCRDFGLIKRMKHKGEWYYSVDVLNIDEQVDKFEDKQ